MKSLRSQVVLPSCTRYYIQVDTPVACLIGAMRMYNKWSRGGCIQQVMKVGAWQKMRGVGLPTFHQGVPTFLWGGGVQNFSSGDVGVGGDTVPQQVKQVESQRNLKAPVCTQNGRTKISWCFEIIQFSDSVTLVNHRDFCMPVAVWDTISRLSNGILVSTGNERLVVMHRSQRKHFLTSWLSAE